MTHEARITRAITDIRRELATRERATMLRLARAHELVMRRLAEELDRLTEELEAIHNAGQRPTIGRLYRMERYRSLLVQTANLYADFALELGREMNQSIAAAVDQAQRDAGALAKAALGPPPPGVSVEALFTKLPDEAITAIVGTTTEGPLAELLASFGDQAARDAREALIAGVALGEHPSRVARRVRDALGVQLWRAATIARTEQLRAYRETHRRWYEANSRVVKGWIWHSALGANTCVACWAMHGREFPLDEPMGTHPSCRCAMVPKTKTWKELGFNVPDHLETSARITPGPELFRRLDPVMQRRILGPKAFDAYRRGEVALDDFVRERRSVDWGITRSRGSLFDARERAAKRAQALPVLDWEVADQRKRIPDDLRLIIGAPTPILRVPKGVYRKIVQKHGPDLAYFERLNEILAGWDYIDHSESEPYKWEVYAPVGEYHVFVTIGRDQEGSYNLVTMFRMREQSFQSRVRNRSLRKRGEK